MCGLLVCWCGRDPTRHRAAGNLRHGDGRSGEGHPAIELDTRANVVRELRENDLPGKPLRLLDVPDNVTQDEILRWVAVADQRSGRKSRQRRRVRSRSRAELPLWAGCPNRRGATAFVAVPGGRKRWQATRTPRRKRLRAENGLLSVGEFLVAAVVAAGVDEFLGGGKIGGGRFPRILLPTVHWRRITDHSRLPPKQPRPIQVDVGQEKFHGAALGDFPGFVQVALRAVGPMYESERHLSKERVSSP